ncbi:ThuA domain-containing protein [Fuerstiella marisgermanici]|uniref:Trehalose utilization n=1 Tax=Fuerstiella marisgermanici TaxID=1891926 RepID=A0A1P8WPB8_9PLAN|nr:ThuA domain-containing protein [Fuerstiella marisgermanici]APZ95900.1 Trehalose utilization [Fuerstiella marisgermanici]
MTFHRFIRYTLPCSVVILLASVSVAFGDGVLKLNARTRAEVSPGSNRFREVIKPLTWDASKTAIVICDMWNDHYCRNAARRVAEMAPRMNEVLKKAREQGVLIIHSPSGCMEQYEDMPQRKFALEAPKVETTIPLQGWCYLNEKHEPAMPVAVDQPSDDDGTIREAVRHFERQIDTLEIMDGDAISDGPDAFYLMKQRGIENVIIMGVHTNMCVLGRPFGIRQMVYQGQNIVLMRDMTDSMYNPRDEPYVNHYTGNDLVFEHIERHWCPTITSADILGGQPFRFPGDRRPHLVIVMAEEGYKTAQTLPPFALKHFGAYFKITCVYANADDRNDIPGIEALNDADVAIWSIRRRTLPKAQLDIVRKFIADGKPLVALRTTSHAFSLGKKNPADGLAEWPEFDSEVLGGNYQKDHLNKSATLVHAIEAAAGHPILHGIPTTDFRVSGTLYKNDPLPTTAAPLMLGHVEGSETVEPVAWTHQRPNGGRVFYTSLGHPGTFEIPEFQRLLKNATYWVAGLPIPASR